MRIGEVSRQTRLSIQTLRFYERKGFLPSPARSSAGYRAYHAADLKRLRFIQQSQQLGFTLKEIKELLDIHGQFAAPHRKDTARWRRAVRIARDRLASIESKLRSLTAMRAQLLGALGEDAEQPQPQCPVAQSPKLTEPIRQKSR